MIKNIVKQKKAQSLFADLDLQAHINEHCFSIKHIYEKYSNLKIVLKDYQTTLTSLDSNALLNKALLLGKILTIEYFKESNYYFNVFNNYLQTEKECYETMA